jgi:ornithine decarboxylase
VRDFNSLALSDFILSMDFIALYYTIQHLETLICSEASLLTERLKNFLKSNTDTVPFMVLDLECVRKKYNEFREKMPDTDIYYAVKANPEAKLLELLVSLGSFFDAASLEEIRMCLAAGATAERISFGNTIKKEINIKAAYDLGIRLFSFDSIEELEKIARVAPEAKVICRILCDGSGADWPLSRKFGCMPDMAEILLEQAYHMGLKPTGISFHVGSQQTNVDAWDSALASASTIFKNLANKNIELSIVNLGGGFPAAYKPNTPDAQSYATAIENALRTHFGNRLPKTLIEPGRGLVGDAGVIQAEVILISKKSFQKNELPWVYLDIGKFGGLAETMDEAIRYPIRTVHDNDNKIPCIIAGPTCDSVDVLYEKVPYMLPETLKIGDKVLIEHTGAYTTTYAANGFNGFAPLKSYCI